MAPPPPPPSTLSSTLQSLISPISDIYTTYIHPLLPAPLQTISSYLAPTLVSGITSLANGEVDIISLAAFLVAIYFSLRIADYIRRSVVAWVIFAVKIVVVLALLNAVVYINRYGWERALRDGEWLVGLLPTGWTSNNANTGSNANSWNAYGGGAKQQVPVGRGGRKRAAGGWS